MTSSLFTNIGFAAAVTTVTLITLQTDACSRLLLSPERVKTKRRIEYKYRWQQALQIAKMKLQYAQAGGFHNYSHEEELGNTL